VRRASKPNAAVLRGLLKTWVKLMAPFAPHICEQIWSEIGEEGFVSNARWPAYDEGKIDIKSEEAERLVKGVLVDTINILKATGIKPRKVVYYTSSGWKWKIYLKALELSRSKKAKVDQLMRSLMADEELRIRAKRTAAYAQKAIKQISGLHGDALERRLKIGMIDEYGIIRDAVNFYERELGADVEVYREDDQNRYDPRDRAKLADPYRPAIFVE